MKNKMFNSKFINLYNLVMKSIIVESKFSNDDAYKPNHTYFKDVISDICAGNPIKLGDSGDQEITIDCDGEMIEQLSRLVNEEGKPIPSAINDFNNIFKQRNINLTWTKIWKQPYSMKNNKRANTTIYSSINELTPCFIFKSPNLLQMKISQFIDAVKTYLQTDKFDDVFVNNEDKKQAILFFNQIDSNDDFVIKKINSGKSIYFKIIEIITDFIKNQKETFETSSFKWCYRSKPEGINPKDPSDVVVEFKNGKFYGFSLKSGEQNTKEPKFNSYINSPLQAFGMQTDFNDKFFNKMKEILNINNDEYKNYASYKKMNKLFLMEKNPSSNEFIQAQTWIINYIIEMFNANKEAFKKYFLDTCIGISSDPKIVGFKVIKGIESAENKALDITPTNFSFYENASVSFQKKPLSKQSMIISFTLGKQTKQFMASIRSTQGMGCFELPNLKFNIQEI